MNRLLAAALAALTLAAPASALDWASADPLAQFGAALAEVPAPAAVAGVEVDAAKPKKECDVARWNRIIGSIGALEAITAEDRDWAVANTGRMLRKTGANREIHRQIRRENRALPRDQRMTRQTRKAIAELYESFSEAVVEFLILNAKIKTA